MLIRSNLRVLHKRAPIHEVIMSDDKPSVASNDHVRAMRDCILHAETRLEEARQYIMFPEIRDRIREAQSKLREALTHMSGE